MKNRSWVHYYVIGFAILLATLQLNHVLLFFSASLQANIDAAIGVTTGHPHWRVYQSRVLGPYLLKGLASLLSGDYTDAYLLLLMATLTLAGYQAWRIGRRIGGEQTGWFALMTLHLLFTILYSKPWLYIWDFIGLNVFLAFVEFVLCERRWHWFAALFAVAILNRDSGQFIALWMILQPVSCWLTRHPLPKRAGLGMVIAGVVCAAAGAWLIDYLRTTLLVEEVGFNLVRGTPSGYGQNFFWAWPSNLYALQHAWDGGVSRLLTVLLSLVILSSIIGLGIGLARRNAARYLGFSITIMILAISILLFGYISETRVFVETIPVLLLGACLLFQSRGLAR